MMKEEAGFMKHGREVPTQSQNALKAAIQGLGC